MGTRADFWVVNKIGDDRPIGEQEWIGSIAWDGYADALPDGILQSRDEDTFRAEVSAFLDGRDDATLPAMGWPWPWPNSATTDCSYWLMADEYGKFTVYVSHFGGVLLNAMAIKTFGHNLAFGSDEFDAPPELFKTDMRDGNAARVGNKRSGIFLFG